MVETVDELLKHIISRAAESVQVRLGGKRLDLDFALPLIENDIPRLLTAVQELRRQRNKALSVAARAINAGERDSIIETVVTQSVETNDLLISCVLTGVQTPE